MAARKKVNMIYIRIAPKQDSQLRVDDPRNLRARMRFTNQGDRWKRMNDVTERTRLND